MSARCDSDRAHYVEQMAIAICNKIRARHGLEPVRDLNDIEDPELYRSMAAAALCEDTD